MSNDKDSLEKQHHAQTNTNEQQTNFKMAIKNLMTFLTKIYDFRDGEGFLPKSINEIKSINDSAIDEIKSIKEKFEQLINKLELLDTINNNSGNAWYYADQSCTTIATQIELTNKTLDELKKNTDATQKILSVTDDIKENSTTLKPGLPFILAWVIGAFLAIGCFIAIIISSKNAASKDDISKLAKTNDNTLDSVTIQANLTRIYNSLSEIKETRTFNISDSDISRITSKLDRTIESQNINTLKKPDITGTINQITNIENKINQEFKFQETAIQFKKDYDELESKYIKKERELENINAAFKLLDKDKGFKNKSLLIVFTASDKLHLSEEIAKELNNLFKHEQSTRKFGFERAFAVLRQRKITPVIEFGDNNTSGKKIEKNITNGDAVNLNDEDVLKQIKEAANKSKLTTKEILVVAGGEGSPPNPETSIFSDNNLSVNIVLVLVPGSTPSRTNYDKWSEWASKNNTTITWLYGAQNQKLDSQILSIIKRFMGKEMGF